MPFSRPTLSQLIEQLRQQFSARIPGADSRLRRSFLEVFARAISGSLNGLYGYLDYIARQPFADTADIENLQRIAAIRGIQIIPATFASGALDATGAEDAVIPLGTKLRRSDGFQYTTTAEATISGGVASLPVTADLAGLEGNAPAGTVLTFLSPVSGVSSTATVDGSELTGGNDRETIESLRERVLDEYRNPAQGGNANDYVQWARQVVGVTRVFVQPEHAGPGTVQVLFLRDDDPSIIPDSGEIAAVDAVIQALRPVTANVTVAAPTETNLDPEIELVGADTAAIRAAIQASLEDLLRRESIPDGTIPLSHIREAISVAAGEFDHILVSPVADVVIGSSNVLTLGTITWS